MWPGFLAKLRESFSLDPTPDAQSRLSQNGRQQRPIDLTIRAAELKRLQEATDTFPPRHVADHLISVLIKNGTDCFFYFDQAALISEVDEFYTDSQSSLRYNTGFVCLALSAFALGSQWTGLAEQGSTPKELIQDGEEIGKQCYAQARLLVPDLDDSMSLQSVQAPFILGVYLLPARATSSLHMYLGLALRKALALDLHLSTEDTHHSPYDREVRSRLWWSVFSLER